MVNSYAEYGSRLKVELGHHIYASDRNTMSSWTSVLSV